MAEYICADLSSRPNFPLQSCRGPYILGTDCQNDRAPHRYCCSIPPAFVRCVTAMDPHGQALI